MSEFLKTIMDALKLSPRHFATVAVFCAAILFVDINTLNQIGIGEFAKNNRPVFGMVFLFSASFLGVALAIKVHAVVRRLMRDWSFKIKITQHLQRLTEDEKHILRGYIAHQTKSQRLGTVDGVAHGLESSGILYLASEIGTHRGGFAFNINDFAWDFLNKHPRLIATVDPS